MALTEEVVASEGKASWNAPKQLGNDIVNNSIARIQAKAGDRVLSVSKQLVEDALGVLTPRQPGNPGEILDGAEDLNNSSRMPIDHAIAILSASAHIPEPVRTTVLTSEQGTIYTFIPRVPTDGASDAK